MRAGVGPGTGFVSEGFHIPLPYAYMGNAYQVPAGSVTGPSQAILQALMQSGQPLPVDLQNPFRRQ